jgi:hypothetical protein
MVRKTLIFALAALFMAPAALWAQGQEPAAKPEAAADTTLPAAPPAPKLEIDAVLCTSVVDREPVGEADTFPADVGKIYLWTKVTGLPEGQSSFIHHVWLRDGVEMGDVELAVKASPWRTYSYKTIMPDWTGDWEVKVVGPDGNVIKSIPFTVGKQAKPDQSEGQ